MQKTKQLLWLDLMRGLAALIVLMGHLRSVLFEDFETIQNPGVLAKAFYFITGFGHQAVILFFVLSGFFIIQSIHDAYSKHLWSWKNYFINRITRLWMVLIPGLLLGAFWDRLGISLNPDFDIYAGNIAHLIYFNPIGHLGFDVFVGNLFFLQTIFFPTYGTNGALWSLSNEFWYYVIFPFLYLAYQFRANAIKCILHLVIGLVILTSFQYFSIDDATHPRDYFVIWLMGGVSILLVKKQVALLQRPTFALLGAVLLMAMLVGIRLQIETRVFNDWGLGLITFILIASLAQLSEVPKLIEKVAAFLSKISYTLYIVHLPFVVFISSQLTQNRLSFTTTHLVYYLVIFIIAIVYAYGVYFVFERNTNRVKNFIINRLFKS